MRTKSKARRIRQKPHVEFESEPKREGSEITDSLILLYGRSKIGKSTFCAQIKGSYFLVTEPGYKFLKIRKTKIKTWEDFQSFVEYMEAHSSLLNSITSFVVDTVDNLGKLAADFICNKHGMLHQSDGEYGKGWDLTFNEFHHWIVRLVNLGKGVIFVAHEVERQVVWKNIEVSRVLPSLPANISRSICSLVDFIFYAGIQVKITRNKQGRRVTKEVRSLYTKPSANIEAGDRTGKLPETLPLDYFVLAEEFTKIKYK